LLNNSFSAGNPTTKITQINTQTKFNQINGINEITQVNQISPFTSPIDHRSWVLWPVGLSPLHLQVFGAAAFLVSVPVFVQAPLVRSLPWVSLFLTIGWLITSLQLLKNPHRAIWGDLLLGFTLTWFTGGLFWGWLRWEPFLHLPVESLAMPLAIWCLQRGKGLIGNWFYLGSLLGTAITDGYFYIMGLIPYWRTLMLVEEESLGRSVLQNALTIVKTNTGITWIIILTTLLVVIGLVPLSSSKLHWWAFAGAVLSTILVDGLFFLVASFA